jgi:hypothetical protein
LESFASDAAPENNRQCSITSERAEAISQFVPFAAVPIQRIGIKTDVADFRIKRGAGRLDPSVDCYNV